MKDQRSDIRNHAMTNQEIDLLLLEKDMPALFHKYQYKIDFMVNYFIGKKLFISSEKEDLIQSVNEALLIKAERIQKNYNNNASISTYLNTIIKNCCLEIYRQKKKVVVGDPFLIPEIDQQAAANTNQSLNKLTIKAELDKLEAILKQFKQLDRLLLYLKLLCRISIEEADVLAYFPQCPEIYVLKLMREFGHSYQLMTDKEIYTALNYYNNLLKGKSTSVDSEKKWLEYKVQQIITKLNNQSSKANYDKDSLKILLSIYFTEVSY